MNSPLQRHEVRLRGLGGPVACGVPRTCASATKDHPIRAAISIIRGEPGNVSTGMIEKADREKRRLVLRPEDVAACVYFALTQSPRCDVVARQVRPHLQVV